MAKTFTSVAPAEVPDEIKTLSEKPLSAVVHPGANFASMSSIEKRILILEKALSSYDLNQIDKMDIDTATKLESLFRDLENLKKQQATAEIDARAKLQHLENVEKQIAQQLAVERDCGARGHRRQDGMGAIGGVIVDGHGFVGTCMRCGKAFKGIGNGPGEVPSHVWESVDHNTIGRA